MSQVAGDGFRPARWAWTTLAGTILLCFLLFGLIVLGSDYGDAPSQQPGRWGRPELNPRVLEAFELGFAIALVPAILVAVAAWRLRKGGTRSTSAHRPRSASCASPCSPSVSSEHCSTCRKPREPV